jgi:hypothetical protein
MTTLMKLSLGAIVLASAAVAACEGGPATQGSYKPPGAAPADAGAADGSSDGGGEKDGGGGDTGGGQACVLKVKSGDDACDKCETAKCCEKINACQADSDCADLIKCTDACYEGKAPDGGEFDAAVTATADKCAEACMAAAPEAAGKLYTTQDDCVGASCKKECWGE